MLSAIGRASVLGGCATKSGASCSQSLAEGTHGATRNKFEFKATAHKELVSKSLSSAGTADPQKFSPEPRPRLSSVRFCLTATLTLSYEARRHIETHPDRG